jgi:hypothetical protein
MNCTRHVVLKVVVKIVSSECDVYPTVDKRKTTGYENKGLQHPMIVMTKLMEYASYLALPVEAVVVAW